MPAQPASLLDSPPATPLVGLVMGSRSDWETMQHAAQKLDALGVPHEVRVVSAHRTPDVLFDYAASARDRGLRAIIAGAGGAAHLPGMLAAKTVVPVLGVPVASKHLSGVDSLHSIVQMPKGVPVATFAIGAAGAANAALFAVAMLANQNAALRAKLEAFRADQTAAARAMTLPPTFRGLREAPITATVSGARSASSALVTRRPPRRADGPPARGTARGESLDPPRCPAARG